MAISTVVEYTNEGLKVAKPEDGERHLVYIRPGDQIQLDFADEVQYRIVDGDVLAILPNGAQLVFLSLGSMSMTPDDGSLPQLVQQDGAPIDILTVAEISELVDQPTPVTNRFLDFQPSSEEVTEVQERLSKQEERLQNTLETIQEYVADLEATAVAGTQQAANAEGEERSGTENTVELVKQTVERVIRAPEESTIPDPVNPETRSQTRVDQQKEVNDNTSNIPEDKPVTNTQLKAISILQVGPVDPTPDGQSTAGQNYIYQGGTGSKSAVETDTPIYRAQNESIDLSSREGNWTVYANNNEWTQGKMSQAIRIEHEKPEGFSITNISIGGLPSDAEVYLNTPGDPVKVDFPISSDNLQAAGDPPEFIIVYPPNSDNFSLAIKINTEYTGDPANAPTTTEQSASATFPIEITDVATAGDIKEITQDSDGNFSPGTFASTPTDNIITTGSGHDTIHGSSGIDIITTGDGHDTIYISEGQGDVLNGGANSGDSPNGKNGDTLVIESGSVKLKLGESGSIGELEYTENNQTYEQSIYSIENVNAAGQNDEITGNSDINTINAGSGEDIIDGGRGSDYLDGGNGADTLSYASWSGQDDSGRAQGFHINISDTAETDIVDTEYAIISRIGSDGNKVVDTDGNSVEADRVKNFENIIGSAGNDIIDARNSAANSLNGGGGDDTLMGDSLDTFNGGDESTNGGEGDGQPIPPTPIPQLTITNTLSNGAFNFTGGDTVDFYGSGSTSGVTVDLTSGTIGGATDKITGIENLKGTRETDTLTLDDRDNVVIATEGNDVVIDSGNANTITREIKKGDEIISAKVQPGIGEDPIPDIETANTSITMTGGDVYDLSALETTDGVRINIGGSQIGDGAISNQAVFSYQTEGNSPQSITATQTVQDFEHVIGSKKGDDITANSATNYINAGGGDDIIRAEVSGTNASDVFDGGEGDADKVIFASQSEGVTIVADGDVHKAFTSDSDANTILLNIEQFEGGDGNDTFTGSHNTSQVETFIGGGGDDTFNASLGGDEYDGGAGKDTLALSKIGEFLGHAQQDAARNFEFDSIDGHSPNFLGAYVNLTPGDDEYGSVQASFKETPTIKSTQDLDQNIKGIENIAGTSYDDLIVGDTNNNTLSGMAGNDLLIGGNGGDTLEGDDGNDILQGGAGNDELDGGAGQDWADYSDQTGAVNITLNSGTNNVAGDTGGSATGAGNDTLKGIEHARGGDGDDIITAGDGVANTLIGGDGDDTFKGLGAGDEVYGGVHNEGDGSGDTADFSHIENGQSVVILAGGDGDAYLIDTPQQAVLAGDNPTNGNVFNKIVLSGIENITGGAGNDRITGDGNTNIIKGGDGDDVIRGGGGLDDELYGGAGDDHIYYSGSENVIRGGGADGDQVNDADDNNDTLDFSEFTSGVTVHLNEKKQVGSISNSGTYTSNLQDITGFENVIGSSAQDIIRGNDRDNRLDGGANNDTIESSAGQDVYIGGDGTDELKYSGYGGVSIDFRNGGNTATSRTNDNDSTSTITGFETLRTGGNDDEIIMGSNAMGGESGANDLKEVYLEGGADTLTFATIDTAEGGTLRTFDGGDPISSDLEEADKDTVYLTTGNDEITFTDISKFTVGSNYTVENFETVHGNGSDENGQDTVTVDNLAVALNGNDLTIGSSTTTVHDFASLTTGSQVDTFKGLGTSDFTRIEAGGGADEFIIDGARVDEQGNVTAMAINGGTSTSANNENTQHQDTVTIDVKGENENAANVSSNITLAKDGFGAVTVGIDVGQDQASNEANPYDYTVNGVEVINANGDDDTLIYQGNYGTINSQNANIGEANGDAGLTFTGIEEIDLTGVTNLNGSDTNLNISVDDLYAWADNNNSAGSSSITLNLSNGQAGSTLTFDGVHSSDLNFNINDAEGVGFDDNSLAGQSLTIAANGQGTITYDDGSGNELDIIVNVSA